MNIKMPSEVLRAAKALIENPENWTQNMYGRHTKTSKRHLMGFDEAATCWCSVGALQKVAGHEEVYHLESRLGEAARLIANTVEENAVHFNDNRSHAEVMHMFDLAIERAEKEEKHGE